MLLPLVENNWEATAVDTSVANTIPNIDATFVENNLETAAIDTPVTNTILNVDTNLVGLV